MKQLYTVLSIVSLLSITLIGVQRGTAQSFPFLEGLYDGEELVVAGLQGSVSEGILLALSHGEYGVAMDTVKFPEQNWTTFGNLRYHKDSDTYTLSGSRYVPGEMNKSSIIKLDSDFNVIQEFTEESEFLREYTSHAVAPDGSVFTVGLSGNDGGNANDFLLVKFDADLNKLWEMNYGSVGNNDYGKDVQYDESDNTLIMIGEGINSENGTLDPVIRKLNPADGSVIWETWFGDDDSFDGCQELYLNSKGNYVVIGENPVAPERLFQFVTAEINPAGEVLHLKYHGSPVKNDAGFAIREKDGGYISAGYSDLYHDNGIDKEAVVMTFDSEFNLIDEFIYPAHQGHATDIVVMPDGTYLAMGMAIQTDRAGFVWNISDLSSIESAYETSSLSSIAIKASDWPHALTNFIEPNKRNTPYTLVDISGRLLSRSSDLEKLSPPPSGTFYLLTEGRAIQIMIVEE